MARGWDSSAMALANLKVENSLVPLPNGGRKLVDPSTGVGGWAAKKRGRQDLAVTSIDWGSPNDIRDLLGLLHYHILRYGSFATSSRKVTALSE